VISNASCTTNCLAPLVKAIDDRIRVAAGLNETPSTRSPTTRCSRRLSTRNLRRRALGRAQHDPGRKTGAAAAVGLVLPHLKRQSSTAIRSACRPSNVSIVDLTFVAKRPTTVEEVNKAV